MPPRSSSPICERSLDLTLIGIGRRDIPQCSPKHFFMEAFYRTFSGGRRPSPVVLRPSELVPVLPVGRICHVLVQWMNELLVPARQVELVLLRIRDVQNILQQDGHCSVNSYLGSSAKPFPVGLSCLSEPPAVAGIKPHLIRLNNPAAGCWHDVGSRAVSSRGVITGANSPPSNNRIGPVTRRSEKRGRFSTGKPPTIRRDGFYEFQGICLPGSQVQHCNLSGVEDRWSR